MKYVEPPPDDILEKASISQNQKQNNILKEVSDQIDFNELLDKSMRI